MSRKSARIAAAPKRVITVSSEDEGDSDEFVEKPKTKKTGKKKATKKTVASDPDEEASEGPKKPQKKKTKKTAEAAAEADEEGGGEQPPEEKKKATTKAKTTTKGGKAKTKKSNSKYISAEQAARIEEGMESFAEFSGVALKDLLRKNGMKMSGTKDELVRRVAECSVLGSIPLCRLCGGGKPDFDLKTETYFCKGYYDDTSFVKCFKRSRFPDINRVPWIE